MNAATPELKTVRLSDVIFDEVIYPRRAHDPVLVQRYAEVIEEIEAKKNFISLSADMKLLDGKHRWLAYRKRFDGEERDISAFVYPVTAPHDQLELSATLNSDHGWQLSDDDKEHTAKTLFAYGFTYERIAAALNVSKSKVSTWLARTVKENKDKRNRKIIDLWMACYTQEEIAEATETPLGTVKRLLGDGDDSLVQKVQGYQTNQAAADHAIDFEPPIYNIWKQQKKTKGSSHFGNSEVRWVDNLLYLYTKPFDVVVDPFAGGGSTIDVCEQRWRRYFISDRKVEPEQEGRIRLHDITTGLPPLPRWKDVALVYLDPPYWKQAEGKYSEDPTDLANMPLDQFNDTLARLIKGFLKKIPTGARVALLMQPTQWNAPEREYTDHVIEMTRRVGLPAMRFSCPYESQQYTSQMVDWAKDKKQCLVLTREMIVWNSR